MTVSTEVIDLMRAHVSVRDFLDKPVEPETLRAVLQAAVSASSSCFLQGVSMIRITDPALRSELARLAGAQKHVQTAAEFIVFCADMRRILLACPKADTGWTEQLVVACHDAGIMAQNALLAAESLGLGGVFIGGIRNRIEKVDALLKLPHLVFPVFGLCLGYPARKNEVKPRFDLSVTLMENTYREPTAEEIAQYDQRMHEYYQNRSADAKDSNWSREVTGIVKRERRPFMADFLKSKGWAKA